MALYYRKDGTLLDCRELFKVCIDEVLDNKIHKSGDYMHTVGVNAM